MIPDVVKSPKERSASLDLRYEDVVFPASDIEQSTYIMSDADIVVYGNMSDAETVAFDGLSDQRNNRL